jgi:hypothetical protein
MNKDASDFMIQEYDQIASAYFGLRDQVNDWFKAYLSLIGLPITVLVAVLKLAEEQLPISIAQLPDVVASLLILVAGLGFFVALSIVAMRMEMILYARTINGIRRYFADLDQKCKSQTPELDLAAYLILPTSDSMPPFFESWRAMFWQVVIIGFIDGAILTVAVQSLLRVGWLWSVVIGVVYGLVHLGVYRWMAWRRERGWYVRFPKNLQPSEWY